ncbi:DUF6095 family protein [Polaribacter sargassicola]|uniref:DUF6095 family protein n=1 Tax=Polaribacter sargassicola TaxID=2836891 RepID=UPI001F3513E9|nr:DUF6095 family protein [Polaribacter sp. DS7-9]
MSTNLNLLGKGIKYLSLLLILYIASPIVLTVGFKALKNYKDTPEEYISYIILSIAVLLVIFSIYFSFKTFKILLRAIFNN